MKFSRLREPSGVLCLHLLILETVLLAPTAVSERSVRSVYDSAYRSSHPRPDVRRLWQSPPRPAYHSCSLYGYSGCGRDECCVKEVISFQDWDKIPVARTLCQPLRAEGELCLRQPEGYLCDCAKNLVCRFVHNETYGHCGPG